MEEGSGECYVTQCIIKKDGEDREIEKPIESRCLERKKGVWWKRWAVKYMSLQYERKDEEEMGELKRTERNWDFFWIIEKNLEKSAHQQQCISINVHRWIVCR